MDGWIQTDLDGLNRAKEFSKYLFLCSCLIALSLTLIGIVVGVLVPEIRQTVGLDPDSEDSAKPVLLEINSKVDSIVQDAKGRADKEIKAQLDREKAAREAEERQAKEAAERAAVWRVATIENRTKCDIYYEVKEPDGTRKGFTVKAGRGLVHWRKNVDLQIKYSYCLNGWLHERTYSITANQVIGHEPTESDQGTAPVTYFSASNRQGIVMYRD